METSTELDGYRLAGRMTGPNGKLEPGIEALKEKHRLRGAILDRMETELRARSVMQVAAIEKPDLRLAYSIAREQVARMGYDLRPENRSSEPKDWSADFRERVILAHQCIRAVMPGLVQEDK